MTHKIQKTALALLPLLPLVAVLQSGPAGGPFRATGGPGLTPVDRPPAVSLRVLTVTLSGDALAGREIQVHTLLIPATAGLPDSPQDRVFSLTDASDINTPLSWAELLIPAGERHHV